MPAASCARLARVDAPSGGGAGGPELGAPWHWPARCEEVASPPSGWID